MRRSVVVLALAIAVIALLAVEPVLAAPGGKIAKAVFESFWGRVLLVVLVIVFAPIIILGMLRERRATRRARADLAWLAARSPAFQWIDLRERALACLQRVHAAWRAEDTRDAADVMTDWYWRNQQLVFLDEWARGGLVNHCTVKAIGTVKPVLVVPRHDATGFEGSKVVLSITANMQDYLARRDSGEIVEGSPKFKDVTHLWTFELSGGQWKVSNIDEAAMINDYLAMSARQPRPAEIVTSPASSR